MKRILCIIYCSLILTACSSFDISDSQEEPVEGVPFYIKKGVVKQTSIYSRSWIEVELEYTILKPDGKPVAGSVNSAKFDIKLDSFHNIELLRAFASAQSQIDSGFSAAFLAFKSELDNSCSSSTKNCLITPWEKSNDLASTTISPSFVHQELISNKSTYESVVDYDSKYYFNTTVPFFGTTTSSVTLATDGTLTTGTSTVDTTKLADVIPLNEYLLKKFKLGDYLPEAEIKDAGDQQIAPTAIINISINKKSHQYNLVKYHPYSSGLNLAPLTFNTPNVSVDVITSNSSSTVPAASSNAIKLNGTIELPKSK
nr:hypothetical protein [Alteromonas macleodii]|tara:strand:+ start:713 stop:1651 length:939 start_codon:yes stop_codon:yes gene_type:complete